MKILRFLILIVLGLLSVNAFIGEEDYDWKNSQWNIALPLYKKSTKVNGNNNMTIKSIDAGLFNKDIKEETVCYYVYANKSIKHYMICHAVIRNYSKSNTDKTYYFLIDFGTYQYPEPSTCKLTSRSSISLELYDLDDNPIYSLGELRFDAFATSTYLPFENDILAKYFVVKTDSCEYSLYFTRVKILKSDPGYYY